MANLIRGNEAGSNAPALWDPFQTLKEVLNWDPFAEMTPTLGVAREMPFSPRFEVKETGSAYVFKADVPGIDEKDLEISFAGNRLTVSGKREAERKQDGETWYAWERSYGAFSRSFTLPDGADADSAEAVLQNGVLTLTLPKRPEHQPRRISIKGIGEKVKGLLGGKEKGSA
jgi:HSP20 family protein